MSTEKDLQDVIGRLEDQLAEAKAELQRLKTPEPMRIVAAPQVIAPIQADELVVYTSDTHPHTKTRNLRNGICICAETAKGQKFLLGTLTEIASSKRAVLQPYAQTKRFELETGMVFAAKGLIAYN